MMNIKEKDIIYLLIIPEDMDWYNTKILYVSKDINKVKQIKEKNKNSSYYKDLKLLKLQYEEEIEIFPDFNYDDF